MNTCRDVVKLWAGDDFGARLCFDLDLQGSDPNVTRYTSTQYGYHFCEIVLIFKSRLQITKLWTGHEFGTYLRTDVWTDNPATICSPEIFWGAYK